VEIGIGLPTTLPADGKLVVEWARRAEERGFSSLATIDRLVYPTYDSLTALAAAAGATSRIGLITDILLVPAYQPMWLAKTTASLHALSGGRLTLGVAPGGREDDFVAAGRPFAERGRLMDEALELLTRAWSGATVAGDQPVTPTVPGGRIPLLIGGNGAAAMRRTVRWGDGWTVGGASPEQAAEAAAKVREAWHAGGREGEPRLAALQYFGLGDDETSAANLRHYYGFTGDYAELIAASAARTPEDIRSRVQAFADAGYTELLLDPTIPDLAQVDRLADIVF
jgi:alkanesulfonate monooxygenase SsuD/methylene tetrahydromethanopterin reductase-like flavin-dependent oxidoreductase (luciferase family)